MIKIDDVHLGTHPLNPLVIKREGAFQSFESASPPFSSQVEDPDLSGRRGQGDEFRRKTITGLDRQMLLCSKSPANGFQQLKESRFSWLKFKIRNRDGV